ncbi:hypothetical protein CITRIK5_50038 [Citricoccus sp. K5]|nr:hypothetical protein CITRIK5_50038 [Citricoccus sp. K5]
MAWCSGVGTASGFLLLCGLMAAPLTVVTAGRNSLRHRLRAVINIA